MNGKITFVELVDLMSKATSTAPRVCELFLRELFGTVSQALIKGETVKIKGVGTFKIVPVKSRKVANISTGKSSEASAYDKVAFTPDKSLADAVNQPFAQFETVMLDDAVTDDELAKIDRESPAPAAPGDGEAGNKYASQPPHAAERHVDEDPTVQPDAPMVDEQPADDADSDYVIPAAPLPFDLPEMQEPAPAPSLDDLIEDVPMPIMEQEMAAAPQQPSSRKSKKTAKAKKEETDTQEKHIEVNPGPAIATPVGSKPMLVGRPIDGPKMKHAPESEPEEVHVDDHFYRPEPRNAYKPTEEQLARQKSPDRRWLWAVLAVLAVGVIVWLFARGGGKSEPENQEVVAQADTVVEVDDVVTDTITSKVVLTTLAEKYYGSQWFWVYIYEENKDIISDPNNVRPGTAVVIPSAEKYGIDVNDRASVKKAQRLSWELLR